jgi:signal transduction histidine kinase
LGIKLKNRRQNNIVSNFYFIFSNGFKYTKTKKILIATIVCVILFIILYLYFLAIGGYENNILVRFFSTYPFKGTLLLMILPLISIIYSLKRTIDISIINEQLQEINGGNLDYSIEEYGSEEIRQLIHNIMKIKDGYRIAIDEAVRNEKIKTQLITNVSHDLRTPLTSIINYVNILGDNKLTEDERRDYIKILDAKSKKLKILIDDLFEMSKINSGKLELVKDSLDIMSLIHQAIGECSYLYEDKNIEFNVESYAEEIYMQLDGKMMSRALENVVINALKYSLENTRIYVDVNEEEDYINIAIKNIANYKMDFNNSEIFERFARGDKSRNSNIEGSGLGLAITKSIIELHQGRVLINREGDMFKIYLKLPK